MGIKFGGEGKKVTIIRRSSSIDPKLLGGLLKRAGVDNVVKADRAAFAGAAAGCASSGNPHQVEIRYWKDIAYMELASRGTKPSEIEVAVNYVLMWRGIMTWAGDVMAGLDMIFSRLQDDGTHAYFSQEDVRTKLQPHPHTSMSVGDIVTVDGTRYICMSVGWESL